MSYVLIFRQKTIKNLKIIIIMELKDAYSKRKCDNITTYQFKDVYNNISTLEATKHKSGYEVEYRDESKDFYWRTDGIKTMKEVENLVKGFEFNFGAKGIKTEKNDNTNGNL